MQNTAFKLYRGSSFLAAIGADVAVFEGFAAHEITARRVVENGCALWHTGRRGFSETDIAKIDRSSLHRRLFVR
jgi:hypothetical protein